MKKQVMMQFTAFYLFYLFLKGDGTYDYYPGFVGANNSMASRNCQWRIDGDFLETVCKGYKNAER